MKGFVALKSFYHDKQYAIGEKVDLPEHICKDLENRDVIKWVERPVIIMPKEKKVTKKTKRNVRKSKKRV